MRGAPELESLLGWAETAPEVVGVYVFGSRGRADGRADDRSDWDVAVVLADDADTAAFDARWPYVHGATVEIARMTLSELRADSGPVYEAVDLRIDKTGEVAPLLAAKRHLAGDERDAVVRAAVDEYVNATYRSLRYGAVGAPGARLDAAESVPPLLTALFALEGRVRPFNKYVTEALPPPFSLERLLAVLDGDAVAQRALFRDVERSVRDAGFGDVLDGWQPDLAWLRGEKGYRE